MKYRIEIDGLRALAVLPVIFFHAGFTWFSGGFVGVDVFFVISGYLITSIIINELSAERFSLTNFYERRARRILPALFMVMAICIPLSIIMLTPSDLKDFGQSLISVSLFSSNILFWLESGYFDTTTELKPLLHTWSLAVEEQFYIIFPLFLILFWRLGISLVLTLLVIVFAISLCLSEWGAYYKPNPTFYLLPTRMWELLVGSLTAIYLVRKKFSSSLILNQVISLIGLAMIVYAVVFYDSTTKFPGLSALLPTVGTAFIILTAVPGTFVFYLLSTKVLVSIGLISYSAYLWHQPLFAFSRHQFDGEVSYLVSIVLCLLSLILAYLSWQWVEKPFRNKSRISRRAIFSFSAVGLVFFSVIGVLLNQSNGLMFRYNEQEQKLLGNFINSAEYVPAYFKLNTLKYSNEQEKTKVVLIGDSYAEDISNAIYESGAHEKISLATFSIPAHCGVLLVRTEKLQPFQPNDCAARGSFYSEPRLLQLIEGADEVWVASRWPEWTLSFQYESFQNLISLNKRVKIFGTKYFGVINSRDYYLFKDGKWLMPPSVDSAVNFVNKLDKLKSISQEVGVQFIDVQAALCGKVRLCSPYDGIDLISFDGEHLTPYGAKKLGHSLFMNMHKGF